MAPRRRANVALMLDRDSKSPLHEQIYGGIAGAIRTGRLRSGDRLPSVRQLSADLFVSHTIVEQAYLELSVEGYVTSKPRSGYIVEAIDIDYFEGEPTGEPELDQRVLKDIGQGLLGEEEEGERATYDFSFMRLREGSFPLRAWQRACVSVCQRGAVDFERYGYQGRQSALQEEIARYLSGTRGIECDPRQILLEPGSPAALMDLLRLFDASRDAVGVEEPGWQVPRMVSGGMGFRCVPLAVARDSGGFVRSLERADPSIAVLTPSHQFPTGIVLPLAQRIEVLEWAKERNACIIEDDSCFEYRYDMRPIPSLYSLDRHDRTVYLGNFSKVLSPSLRIAYLVLPPRLLETYLRRFPSGHPGVSAFDAAVLAELMATGDYDRHVTRMVNANRRCHDRLLGCLTETFGSAMAITGKHAGMHLFCTMENGMSTAELIASALARDAKVYSPERYWFSRDPEPGALMVGFSALLEEQVPLAVRALGKAWL